MIALAIVLFLLIAFLLLRAGVTAEYSELGFALSFKLGFIKLSVLPRKKEKRRKKEKKKEQKKPEKAEKPRKGGGISELLNLLPAISKALGRLRRRIVIDELTLHVTIAGDDPAQTGINYGRAYAVIGAITPALENLFRIKKRSITAGVSFIDTKMTVYCKASLSIAMWAILYIAFGALASLVKIKFKATKKRKAEESNGKSSDSGSDGDNNAENQGAGGR